MEKDERKSGKKDFLYIFQFCQLNIRFANAEQPKIKKSKINNKELLFE